jgi:hypothetical protein
MSLTYDYAVTGLKTATVNTFTDVITTVQWTLTGTDDVGNTGSFSGVTPYSLNTATTFIPFNSLTENEVLSWVQTTLSNDSMYFQHIVDQIESQIAIKTAAVAELNVTALPWASPAVDTTATTTVVDTTATVATSV